MRKLFYLSIAMTLAACGPKKADNPFFHESQAPYGAVEFEKISSEDFMPAFEEGFRQHKLEIDAIAECTEEPTFQNTIDPLEASGQLLARVGGVFYNLIETDADDILKETEEKIAPMSTEDQAYIYMNDKLFTRISKLYDNKTQLGLTREQEMVLDKYYRAFVNGGAKLDAKGKARLQEIDTKLSLLQMKFSDNMLDETNSYLLNVTDKSQLAGLADDQLEAAAKRAKDNGQEGWSFNIQKPCLIPFLQQCSNRDLREQMYKAYYTRGNNNNEFDNKAIIKEILELRLEKANMLGYETFADLALSTKMAKTPEAAYGLLMQIWEAALPQAKREVAELQSIIDAEGGNFTLAAWDWWYYAEKLRKQKYDLDEAEIQPYFSLENVRKGSIAVVEKLFGIKLVKAEGLQVYNPGVETWECLDSDGSHLAYFYTDCVVRPTKRQGAWMNNFIEASDIEGRKSLPSIVNVCNFSAPTDEVPTLLSIDDARTVFHEFGHALHGMLTKAKYPSVSGTGTPTDFVELPSQIMEHWAIEPEVMKSYALHYKTGEAIPDYLIEKLQNAGHFNTGFETVELVGAALLDMEYHMQKDYSGFEDEAFEKAVADKIGMIDQIEYRYRGTFFNHIFNNGYSAGYYSYLWAEVLDCDGFQAFVENGLFDKETGMSLRKNIYEMGGSEEPMELFKRFRGAEPTPDAMLRMRGLK